MQGRTHDIGDEQLRRAMRLARASLERYGVGNAHLKLLRHDFMQVFRVREVREHGRRDYVLRLYGAPRAAEEPTGPDPRLEVSASLRSPEVLRSQLAWLSALSRDTGLLIPEPVRTLDGELVGDVRVEGTPWQRHSALVRWVPGKHKREDLGKAHLREVGSFVAKMHAHAERYPLPEGSKLPRWDWHWAFGESVRLWSEGPRVYSDEEMRVYREAARLVWGHLEELGEGSEVFGLIHRDLKLDNIVFSGRRVGVLDFDLTGLGHHLYDLTILRSAVRRLPRRPESGRGPLWAAKRWAALLEGYEGVRPLPGPRARLEPLLDALRVMHRVGMINNQLGRLGSEANGQGGLGPEFLRTTVTWLRAQVRHLAT